jgi:hypothetical protein
VLVHAPSTDNTVGFPIEHMIPPFLVLYELTRKTCLVQQKAVEERPGCNRYFWKASETDPRRRRVDEQDKNEVELRTSNLTSKEVNENAENID